MSRPIAPNANHVLLTQPPETSLCRGQEKESRAATPDEVRKRDYTRVVLCDIENQFTWVATMAHAQPVATTTLSAGFRSVATSLPM